MPAPLLQPPARPPCLARNPSHRCRPLSFTTGSAHQLRPSSAPNPSPLPPLPQISEWYVEVDEQGNPLVRPEDAGEDEAELAANMRSLARRDAAAFIRAVKRYGLLSKMGDIASEVGAVVGRGRRAAVCSAGCGVQLPPG